MSRLLGTIQNDTETKTGSVEALFVGIIKSQLDIHLTHILNKDNKLATHKALQKYYEDVDGLMDTLLESYMGIYNVTKITVREASNVTSPIPYLTSLYSEIEKNRKVIKESWLQNQIDEIQALTAHTLYRLKHVNE